MSTNKAIIISRDAVKLQAITTQVDEQVVLVANSLPDNCIVLFIDKAEWPSIKRQMGAK